MKKWKLCNKAILKLLQIYGAVKIGAIALSYPPIVIDDSSWKNAAESFTVALTLTLRGYEESAIAPKNFASCYV